MQDNIPLYILGSLTFLASLAGVIISLSQFNDGETANPQRLTSATILDLEKTELYEGYTTEIDVNNDALIDLTLTLVSAENGKAKFNLEKSKNACQAQIKD